MAGDVILMDEGGHVVQFTGGRDAAQRNIVVSFSPRPIWGDGSREFPLESVRPEVTSVESLIEEMIELYPDVPTDWQNISLKVVRLSQVF
jgi:ASC-1-like (ASCH) protein